MTRPDHTAVPPADVIAAAELLETLSSLTRPLEGRDRNQPGWHHSSGWNDALRHVMDVVRATARAEGAAPTAAQAARVSAATADEVETAKLAAAHYGRPESDVPALVAFERHRAAQSTVPGMPGLSGAIPNFVAGFHAGAAIASHAPDATLAASRDAESATSGATSAAKVELEDTPSYLIWEPFRIGGWSFKPKAEYDGVGDEFRMMVFRAGRKSE
jgi:hypothetical protein